jgi:PhzF family phenazine biosynthesis protein
MNTENLYRLSAFTEQPAGGNPAGVWIGDELPSPDTMRRIAAEVGYSETAFVAPRHGAERTIRYYSPEAEVSFCGHATIATGVQLGRQDGEGRYRLQTTVGEVPVDVRRDGEHMVAALTSVAPRHEAPAPELLDAALQALGWRHDELDPELPPGKAYAGAWHLVIAVSSLQRLDALEYDFDALKALMLKHELTTLQLIWRESPELLHARDPFPVGGVVEDPATGAAAAALGGYLRDAGHLKAPARFRIRQGERMGRPSLLTVDVPAEGGIVVSGTAVEI